ncbi:MAG: alpha/beta fold hydrolase [Inquilinus sp.]|nr:alpha/beta fold hydrolase [Inquilinus sp.]
MREAMQHEFISHDGTRLFYRTWPASGTAKRAIVLFHRGHEHSGRWQDVVDGLDLADMAMFAWDARGHGRSPGQRGYAPSFGTLVRDADAFVRHVSHAYGIPMENIVVLGHSVGSGSAATWVHDYAPPIRALVLGSPALRIRLYVPFAIPALRLWQRLKVKAFVRSYVKGRLLTRDPEKQRSYDEDPLIAPAIAVNILLGVHDAGTRLIQDAAAITVPTLVLTSGADFVVDRAAQRIFFDRLGAAEKAMHVFPGFLHDTFNERDNHLPIAMARQFIRDAFAYQARPPCLLSADRDGPTYREYQALAAPLPRWSPRRLGYAVTRALLATIGRLSDGVRLGWRRGFDSGAMLDYVYRDRASPGCRDRPGRSAGRAE